MVTTVHIILPTGFYDTHAKRIELFYIQTYALLIDPVLAFSNSNCLRLGQTTDQGKNNSGFGIQGTATIPPFDFK